MIPFRMPPPLSLTPIILDSYSTPVCQGEGFGREDSGSLPRESGGACASDSGLLQPDVCCDQGYGGVGGRSSTSQL